MAPRITVRFREPNPQFPAGDRSPVSWSIPPTKMMPLMALVTLISGVCNAGFTFQTTWKPMKMARMKTVRWPRKSLPAVAGFGGMMKARPSIISPTTASSHGLTPVPSSWPWPEGFAAATAAELFVGTPGSGGGGCSLTGAGQSILPS